MPRLIPALGLIGAPLLIALATAALFRGNDSITVLAAIATVPIFLWELSLGIWLVARAQALPLTTGMAEPNVAAWRRWAAARAAPTASLT